ncbi:hypothetical protein F9C07_2287165 [Aspergillus flavus]|uniref:Uncharacterized protein n=1 Tax=Aspergillus flavus (strain ATCC 200026 / FGSC A1120 / IAM 13836 / NRRL 3357 / JCM 12722 / SRRC 167) TaxID=332952 RepID=A0A7U2R1F4_ASPFN|nr:hypothetical protein F9C07_2287165 [Aspergillus flavus]
MIASTSAAAVQNLGISSNADMMVFRVEGVDAINRWHRFVHWKLHPKGIMSAA